MPRSIGSVNTTEKFFEIRPDHRHASRLKTARVGQLGVKDPRQPPQDEQRGQKTQARVTAAGAAGVTTSGQREATSRRRVR